VNSPNFGRTPDPWPELGYDPAARRLQMLRDWEEAAVVAARLKAADEMADEAGLRRSYRIDVSEDAEIIDDHGPRSVGDAPAVWALTAGAFLLGLLLRWLVGLLL
jgi:hypothetical protein